MKKNETMRRVIWAAVLLVLAVPVFAQTPNSGDDFKIKQNAQGTITITAYTGNKEDVVIPETIEGIRVTEIGSRAFAIGRPERGNTPNDMLARINDSSEPESNSIEIISVVIPNTVTTIGSHAFFRQKLTAVTFSESLKTIGDNAFFDNRLTSVTIPDSVTSIGSKAFANNSLTSVKIPNSLTLINDDVFSNNRLTSVTIPNSVKEIGSSAFANNSLTSITLGNRIEKLGSFAFANNKLTTISLPASLKTLGEDIQWNAFLEEKNATFGGNDIQTITLPANAKFSFNWIGNNFSEFYKSQNKKAGTYTWTGRIWTVQ